MIRLSVSDTFMTIQKWQLLSTKDVSPSKWFPVHQHQVQLPDGRVIDDYFVAPFGDVAMVLPVTVNNEVVMVRQYKHGIGEVVLELPAGFQQPGKSLEETAVSELEEEVGIKVDQAQLKPLAKMAIAPTKSNLTSHCFIATGLEFNSQQNLDDNEQIEVVRVPSQDVWRMISSGEIWVADTVAFLMIAMRKHTEIFD